MPCSRRAQRTWRKRRHRESPAYTLWTHAKQRAREQMVAFGITEDDVRRAWPADGRCPALGIPLERGDGFLQDGSPTLDRVNPAWGYEPGNIAVLSMRANRAKGGMQAKELDAIAQWMRTNGLD